ncbi:DUF2059 domain-containing protein [Vibrio quintilis]|uniref:DUF2059 domain-containing protein n=1 Tax=Vibrio quintilis TaxID=1117707 RepID=A0A1M7YYH1_9VIBR|nr:DUF2059 domain-containing protein [Vibrio quintilis]SHO57727.1 hypothetical protein VQ7734_03497 [Vibrio quintilis]
MKKYLGLLLISVSLTGAALAATSPKTETAEKLIEIMNMDKQMLGGFEAMLPTIKHMALQMKLNDSESQEMTNIYRDWFNQDIDRQKIKQQITGLYSDNFSQNEMKDIIRFYKTPTGQKFLKAMPELAKKAAQLGVEQAQSKQQQLLNRLSPFLKKHHLQ